MGVLEQINQMRSNGISDNEIIKSLREQGVTPREIEDSFSKLQIKNAVSGDISDSWIPEAPVHEDTEIYSQEQTGGAYPQEDYTPQPNQQYPAQQDYYPQEGNLQEGYGYPSAQPIDTDNMIEIAEQVFSEKVKNLLKQIEALNEFKTLSQTKIDYTLERLKRIESMIDQLQISILDRVSSYGKSLDNTKKELTMMQDSFEKMINPIIDNSERKLASGVSNIATTRKTIVSKKKK
ncbi:MAG: hypothetical protein AABW81_03850 [Nanoarchaeota archaeon]